MQRLARKLKWLPIGSVLDIIISYPSHNYYCFDTCNCMGFGDRMVFS